MVSEKWYTYKDGEKMNIIFILILMKFSKQKKKRNCILDCEYELYTGIKYFIQKGLGEYENMEGSLQR